MRRVGASVRTHPIVTGIIAIAIAVAVVVSVLIGLDLVITFGLMVVVAIGAVLLWRWWRCRRPGHPPPTPVLAGRMGLAAVAISGVATFALIQAVPYGRDHSNPPVTGEPAWADARTRQYVVDACFACHSNEVDYPPYASIAPISWMTQRHVEEGREAVNYSEFVTDPGDAEESVEVIEEGEMPPGFFTRFGLHPEARLDDRERAELIAGLRATPGLSDD